MEYFERAWSSVGGVTNVAKEIIHTDHVPKSLARYSQARETEEVVQNIRNVMYIPYIYMLGC
jgi:hypothetical protein